MSRTRPAVHAADELGDAAPTASEEENVSASRPRTAVLASSHRPSSSAARGKEGPHALLITRPGLNPGKSLDPNAPNCLRPDAWNLLRVLLRQRWRVNDGLLLQRNIWADLARIPRCACRASRIAARQRCNEHSIHRESEFTQIQLTASIPSVCLHAHRHLHMRSSACL